MLTELNIVEITPSSPPVGTVIWLHGLGADGHDFVPIIEELHLPTDLPLRFVFPHAPLRPVTINNGYVMRAWYDVYSMAINQRVDQEGILQSVALIKDLIEKEERQHGISARHIALGGFSQGAVIALNTGLRFAKSLAGIFALSGYLPHPEKALTEAHAANYTTPVFVAHGTDDTVVPFFLGQQISAVLEKNKYLVNWHSYPMAHTVCKNEIGDFAEWLRNLYPKT